MGVHAILCETFEELPEKMKEFLEYSGDKLVFMECSIETNEHVFPMVRLLLISSLEGLT
jgi:acetolactate synthase I/II/III large subunit